jgi:hypothetical protein
MGCTKICMIASMWMKRCFNSQKRLSGISWLKRTVVHKLYIPKVMFCAANARPRWDAGRNEMFDGKVGMWPIATQVPAARSSRNRSAGTLESGSHIR